MNSLKDTEALISNWMQRYSTARKHLTRDAIPFVRDINEMMVNHSGKQLRPLLTLLCACSCGMTESHPNADNTVDAAVAFETLHNSTLIHDDVVDQSDMRRGKSTLNSMYGNKIAVLVGDYYLSQVMRLLNKIDIHEVTAAAERAICQMSQGELIQLQNIGNHNCSQDTYLDIITKKTASFLAECCHVGAILATDDSTMREAARTYGLFIGIAFQIRDDIIDFMPSCKTGKPQGNDLQEHKFTLPLILTLQNCNENTKKHLFTLLDKEQLDKNEIDSIVGIVTENKGTSLAHKQMLLYLDKAAESATMFPKNQYSTALTDITRILKEY